MPCMSDDERANNEVTTLGIRVPEELREKIREAARIEHRTESSFARYYLTKAAEAVLADDAKLEAAT